MILQKEIDVFPVMGNYRDSCLDPISGKLTAILGIPHVEKLSCYIY